MKTIVYAALALALLFLPFGETKAQTSITGTLTLHNDFTPSLHITLAAKNRVHAQLEISRRNNDYPEDLIIVVAQIIRNKPDGSDASIIFEEKNIPFTVPASGSIVLELGDDNGVTKDESGVQGGYYTLAVRVERPPGSNGGYAIITERVPEP